MRGIIVSMMRTYELMVVVRPTVDVTDQTKQESVITKFLGSVTVSLKVTLLGKKQLAYMIDDCTEGIYLLGEVSAEKLSSSDLEKHRKVNTDVLRFLLTAK